VTVGLQQGLVMHMDDLRTRAAITDTASQELSGYGEIHPDWLSQIKGSNIGSRASELEVLDSILRNTEKFLQQSKQEQQALSQNNKLAPLHKTRSSNVAFNL